MKYLVLKLSMVDYRLCDLRFFLEYSTFVAFLIVFRVLSRPDCSQRVLHGDVSNVAMPASRAPHHADVGCCKICFRYLFLRLLVNFSFSADVSELR
jgi:hypothetical protein